MPKNGALNIPRNNRQNGLHASGKISLADTDGTGSQYRCASVWPPPNNSSDASGGSVFRNLLGAAEGALICAAASTQTLGAFFFDSELLSSLSCLTSHGPFLRGLHRSRSAQPLSPRDASGQLDFYSVGVRAPTFESTAVGGLHSDSRRIRRNRRQILSNLDHRHRRCTFADNHSCRWRYKTLSTFVLSF